MQTAYRQSAMAFINGAITSKKQSMNQSAINDAPTGGKMQKYYCDAAHEDTHVNRYVDEGWAGKGYIHGDEHYDHEY